MVKKTYSAADKLAWQRQRAAGELQRGLYNNSPRIQAFVGGEQLPKKPAKGPSVFKRIDDWLNKEIQNIQTAFEKEVSGKLRKTRTGPVVWTGDSDCFSDLEYSKADGGVYATFMNPTRSTYFYPMSEAQARAWLVDHGDEPGTYANAIGLLD